MAPPLRRRRNRGCRPVHGHKTGRSFGPGTAGFPATIEVASGASHVENNPAPPRPHHLLSASARPAGSRLHLVEPRSLGDCRRRGLLRAGGRRQGRGHQIGVHIVRSDETGRRRRVPRRHVKAAERGSLSCPTAVVLMSPSHSAGVACVVGGRVQEKGTPAKCGAKGSWGARTRT